MKNIVVTYGSYSALFLILIGLISFFALGGADAAYTTYSTGEVIGYGSILLCTAFVILGIRRYRDEKGGSIGFGESLKVGALIMLFPALAFAIYNVVYTEYLDPEFASKYYEYQLDKALADADPAEYETVRASMAAQKEMFANVPFQTVVMFFTVYVIGFIVNVVASLVMSRKGGSG